MQINDILILVNGLFFAFKENKLKKVKFLIKPKKVLISDTLLIFNGCILS